MELTEVFIGVEDPINDGEKIEWGKLYGTNEYK